MNQNMGRLIRYILIIHRLSGHEKYVSADDMISFLNLQMELRGYEVGISLRTLQRDFKEIESMFEIEIENRRGVGYFISERSRNAEIRYEELLMNFDLLTSLNHTGDTTGFIIPEHHRPKGAESIPVLIHAIKNCRKVTFDYRLVRKDNRIISKYVKPHFLKESLGLWYLIALDEHHELRTYAVDRISNLEIRSESFVRSTLIDPDRLFKNSYGVWDDESLPVEEIELSYSPLDGYFLKSMPLHTSQEILVDNEDEFRIRVNLRITNDFVMALLARSHSLTVIKPMSLRRRINEIYRQGLRRNEV